ncbi:MAG: chemotaxis protein CheW [Mariprofundaceae bacterium]|nr:chemotaxis protein CheW [Mariprofundaceae bacterium]
MDESNEVGSANGKEPMSQMLDDAAPSTEQDAVQDISESIPEISQSEFESEYVDLLQLRMGGRDFLLPVSEAAEIVRPMPLTPVPMAPNHLLGMANIHGQIVCVIEPGRQLSLPEKAAPDSDATRYIVLRHKRMRVALRVDAVPAIHRVNESDFETMTDAGAASLRGRLNIQGIGYDVLDVQALLQE